MIFPPQFFRTQVSFQPILNMVDIFQESTDYERSWLLPFNSLALCVQDDPVDPSWCELPEKKFRQFYHTGDVTFTTCHTPMRIRYTRKNLHYCLHFRYELFPGVDLFSGLKERWKVEDHRIAEKIRMVFTQTDPIKKIVMAEAVALETLLKFLPEKMPLDLEEMAKFRNLLEHIKSHLNSQTTVSDMAKYMGWSEAYFSRQFHKVFHITPKQYLLRELFAKAVAKLNDPHKSIKETAEELKFSTEFNFSRFIKHCSGSYPSELRKKSSDVFNVRK